MIFHDIHTHYHFEDFAQYELYRVKSGELKEISDKVSFCVVDILNTHPGPPTPPRIPTTSFENCQTDSGIHGISVGWADIYGSGTPGQEFDISDRKNPGRYCLVARTDPADRLDEIATGGEDNNIQTVQIRMNKKNATEFGTAGADRRRALLAARPAVATCGDSRKTTAWDGRPCRPASTAAFVSLVALGPQRKRRRHKRLRRSCPIWSSKARRHRARAALSDSKRVYLRFSHSTANTGAGPLEIYPDLSTNRCGTKGKRGRVAHQAIYHDANADGEFRRERSIPARLRRPWAA